MDPACLEMEKIPKIKIIRIYPFGASKERPYYFFSKRFKLLKIFLKLQKIAEILLTKKYLNIEFLYYEKIFKKERPDLVLAIQPPKKLLQAAAADKIRVCDCMHGYGVVLS